MLTRLENWNRNPPAQAPVDPVPSASARSRSTTRPAPAAARWYAALTPTTPPPTTTTSAVPTSAPSDRRGGHDEVLERDPDGFEDRDVVDRPSDRSAAHQLRQVGDDVVLADRALADRDQEIARLCQRGVARLHDDARLRDRRRIELARIR